MPTEVAVLSNRFPEIISRLGLNLDRELGESAESIARRVTTGMAEQKSGRMYGLHQASAPGEMPAIDTGNLAAIKVEHEGDEKWVVYTEAEYAAHLEFGAAHVSGDSVGAILYPRPFFVPATEAEGEELGSRLRDLERGL